ncbi:BA14K family protein [Neorhizobium alkalisoli]|uniref:Lectin-like protein BA14k n=1 Tax=Neorhizobium alkalisoli TaxID=528178 RepID=A0A561Q0R5_9HYPH|nr:BA14K family protein [Neorhizobium alkalisoli]TWF43968.1 BA14K-like protein [Neorhizobium alkalisoli]
MIRLTKALCALSISAVVALTSFTGASAMPISSISTPHVSNVEQVQFRNDRRERRHWNGNHRNWRRHDGRHGRYYNGRHHHGSRAGAVLGGLAAGAIIGGALASQPRASGGSHVSWCSSHYRTYRASDNTYVPRAGVRAQCNSPYN